MDEDTVVTRASNVAYQPLDEGGVLLHLETGAYHRVNAIGALIWDTLGDMPLADVMRAVEEEVEGPVPETLLADIEEFLELLAQRDLVVVRRD